MSRASLDTSTLIAELPGSFPSDLPGSWPTESPTNSELVGESSSSHDEFELSPAQGDHQSAYWSVRSGFSIRSFLSRTSSLFSNSTGFRSINGATWREELIMTMNSGFGRGAPRDENYHGVREGRERGGFLPPLRGVGRIGKPPVTVPASMVRALKAGKPRKYFTAWEVQQLYPTWQREIEELHQELHRRIVSPSTIDGALERLGNIEQDLATLEAEMRMAKPLVFARGDDGYVLYGPAQSSVLNALVANQESGVEWINNRLEEFDRELESAERLQSNGKVYIFRPYTSKEASLRTTRQIVEEYLAANPSEKSGYLDHKGQ